MIRKTLIVLVAAAALGACETMPEFMNQPLGSSTGAQSSPSASAAPAAAAAAPASYAQSPSQQLLELERQLSAMAQDRGLGGALASVVDGDGFVVRAGQMYEGPEQVAAGLTAPANAGPIYWQPDRVEVSGAGDMGMTSGRYVQVITGSEAVQGRYVAVWRRNTGGEWKLLSESRIADPPRAAPRPAARRR